MTAENDSGKNQLTNWLIKTLHHLFSYKIKKIVTGHKSYKLLINQHSYKGAKFLKQYPSN